MSVSPDPAATVEFTFETVDGRRLPFRTRFITRRQRMAHDRLVDSFGGHRIGSPELDALVDQALTIGMDQSVTSLEAMDLTDNDIIELAVRYPAAAAIGEDLRGKSLSRRLSVPALSATAAPAAAATTPQP